MLMIMNLRAYHAAGRVILQSAAANHSYQVVLPSLGRD